MSDFDKEAEREKLREQFAEDDRERESTQRMSELLLQGATMTNRHCDVHGDPVFRYDGQEFCPTCRSEGQQPRATEAPTAPEQQDGAAAERSPAEVSSADAPDARRPVEPEGQHSEQSPAPDESSSPPEESLADLSPGDIAGADWAPDPDPTTDPDATRQADAPRQSRPAASHADLSDARASLARTVTRFTEQAEGADDLARAREYLAAVEDAANALEAVRNAEK
ncbi:Sjogren's syndrome/scleroderma autoantigen 1 family protein [Halomarina oriensis]|uniref:Sjogrens syndrome scleroderma autoantigen 1 n=1 Tax=Halomarina oriensis TaxID=671145 RepID=A0A6B0GM54_9EURY|nr:Sjogren's syndrome/scleroderma autoantigen 1 family protein [Halomarina oriensis]MWG34767.1 hypothetical protein [Halomarina oriensis]